MTPKFHLLYYKNLLDACFYRFFDMHNDEFIRDGRGRYVMSKSMTQSRIAKIFRALLRSELKKYVREFNILEPEYFLIIGSCMPKDNLLLKFKTDKDATHFSTKLDTLIKSDVQIKYILKEKDIKIDVVKFNAALTGVFDELFSSEAKVAKLLDGDNYRNVIFVKHKNLDCYSLFKVIKFIYGRNNCTNIYAEQFEDKRSPIIAINELIDSSIHNKAEMNKSPEFRRLIEEIKLFLEEKRLAVTSSRFDVL